MDGKRHDLEMHTVHLPEGGEKNGFRYAALGIFFSVSSADPVEDWEKKDIDKFFAEMKWDTEGNPRVDLVSYGSLMTLVDTDNRWVYKGSVTTPPCHTLVYWNVVRKVYPIS